MALHVSIARVLLPIAAEHFFDYSIPESIIGLLPGDIVEIPFGKRWLLGVVIELTTHSQIPVGKLRSLKFLPKIYPHLSEKLRKLLDFAAQYYQQPLGLMYALAIPPRQESYGHEFVVGFRFTGQGYEVQRTLPAKAKVQQALWRALEQAGAYGLSRGQIDQIGKSAATLARSWVKQGWLESLSIMPTTETVQTNQLMPASVNSWVVRLNAAQLDAVHAVQARWNSFARFLLHGVTGSGKTEVYATLIAEAMQRQQQVLLLVPEINLTPKILQRFCAQFPSAHIEALHSNIADGLRRTIANDTASGKVHLLIGTRLAVFASFARLGLILVDEEHDTSYKQSDGIRYSARDLAIYRAQLEEIPIVLGSATPSLESYWQGLQGRYQILCLPERAIVGAQLARPQLVATPLADEADGLSDQLVAAIQNCLNQKRQSLIFVNRRGYAPSLFCRSCGWAALCTKCSARMTLHLEQRCLRCHHCGYQTPITAACPTCGNLDLLPLGVGTERVTQRLSRLFPAAQIARIDRDTMTRKKTWENTLTAVEQGAVDILVGTQMLAKGHHFPRLGLVGILGADQALYSADFRATERAYALLLQVAGRVGRTATPGQILLQTMYPDHPLYLALQDGSLSTFAAFSQTLLQERRQAALPPYTFLAVWRAESKKEAALQHFCEYAHRLTQEILVANPLMVECFPPVTPALERRAGWYRRQILLQSVQRITLQHFLLQWCQALTDIAEPGVRWFLDVDPLEVV